MKRFPPFNPKFPFVLHGGDYNPDQWRHIPGTVDEDFELFQKAGINTLTLGVFAWSALEPEEGRFEFGWLDDIMDRCAARGMAAVLATPSGGKPNWMALKYPEIRRMVSPTRPWGGHLPPLRETQETRHNHCYTSPVYREKCAEMNTRLAQRYAKHPALALWHVSNEYGGDCYCPLCFGAFHKWLQKKYSSLDALNLAWWADFWSHRFNAWEEINTIDASIEGQRLDWKRFTTDQTVDFFLAECAPLRRHAPGVPVCINNMGFYEGLNYWRFAPHVDVVTVDCYPDFSPQPDPEAIAASTAMNYDLQRSMKNGMPFLLMESSPGPTNWAPGNRQLRPGGHRMKSFQAVAHGADSVQYFQMRKCRGGFEKLQGAVIDHAGAKRTPETRVFREVSQVGRDAAALAPVLGAATDAKVAVMFDWESRWALDISAGPTDRAKNSLAHCMAHHRAFWKRGVAMDVISGECSLEGYDVVVAPSLHLLRNGFADRIQKFTEAGGVFVATWLTGWVDENFLAFPGGFPGPLAKLLGVWAEEPDYLNAGESNAAVFAGKNVSGLRGEYELKNVCEVLHAEGAEVVATYQRDYYAGGPCVTVNKFGKGEAWYIAADGGRELLDAFYAKLIARKNLPRALADDQPEGVAAQTRENENGVFTFVANYSGKPAVAELGPAPRADILSGAVVAGATLLPPYGVMVLQ